MNPNDESKMLGRLQATLEFLDKLPEGAFVAAAETSGFLKGFHGDGDLPEDEIEVMAEKNPAKPAANPVPEKWDAIAAQAPTWFSAETKQRLPELLHQFETEVDIPIKKSQADGFEDTECFQREVDLQAVTMGWAIGKGLNPTQAQAFASFVRYKTPMA